MTVVGIFVVTDPDDPFWFDDRALIAPTVRDVNSNLAYLDYDRAARPVRPTAVHGAHRLRHPAALPVADRRAGRVASTPARRPRSRAPCAGSRRSSRRSPRPSATRRRRRGCVSCSTARRRAGAWPRPSWPCWAWVRRPSPWPPSGWWPGCWPAGVGRGWPSAWTVARPAVRSCARPWPRAPSWLHRPGCSAWPWPGCCAGGGRAHVGHRGRGRGLVGGGHPGRGDARCPGRRSGHGRRHRGDPGWRRDPPSTADPGGLRRGPGRAGCRAPALAWPERRHGGHRHRDRGPDHRSAHRRRAGPRRAGRGHRDPAHVPHPAARAGRPGRRWTRSGLGPGGPSSDPGQRCRAGPARAPGYGHHRDLLDGPVRPCRSGRRGHLVERRGCRIPGQRLGRAAARALRPVGPARGDRLGRGVPGVGAHRRQGRPGRVVGPGRRRLRGGRGGHAPGRGPGDARSRWVGRHCRIRRSCPCSSPPP